MEGQQNLYFNCLKGFVELFQSPHQYIGNKWNACGSVLKIEFDSVSKAV